MEKKKFNKKLLIKISILVVCLILSVPLVILPASTVIVYEMIFSMRFETQPYQMQEISDYEGLTVERSDFKSDVTIAGYKYSKPNQEVKGLVIISHGLGDGGHNKFMGYIDEFTSNGYYVFTYDAQGTDNSGGSSSSGFPQGIIDLDNAIDHAKEIEEYKGLPIMLFGHSWGAYSVGNVLNHHPEVSAAVMVAGFNEPEEMMGYYPRKVLGGFVDVVLLPYVSFYERVKFGKDYANITAVEGIEGTDAEILVVHSKDDQRVPFNSGYEIYKEAFLGEDRVQFIEYEDKGHKNLLYSDEAVIYQEKIENDYQAYLEESGKRDNKQNRQEYMGEHFDAKQYYEPSKEIVLAALSLFE